MLEPTKQTQEIYEDEIDLREYINVIIKRKKLILAIFLVAVVVSAIASFFQPKVYMATVSIMITPSKLQNALQPSTVLLDVGKKGSTGEYLTSQPSLSLNTHEVLLKSSLILERVIRKLNLKDSSGGVLSNEALSKKVKVKMPKETNLIELVVSDAKPQEAMEIANTWAREYVGYSQELILGEVKGAGDFVVDQFEIARKNLFNAEEKVNDFNKRYKLDLMKAELAIKKATLGGYSNELAGMELGLKTKEDSLSELKKQIATQEKFIIVSKAITDDALWQVSSKEKSSAGINKSGLRSEIINPIYQDLETRIVNIEIEINTLRPRVEYLNKSIESVKSESRELENDIIQKEFDLTQLTREVDICKKTYNIFSDKIEEARIIKAAQLGEVKIVSPAIAPSYPAGQNKKQKVAIAGIVSLMLGVFLSFCMEFWQKGKK